MMQITAKRATAADFEELTSFLDRVFTAHNGTPMDFKAAYPRIFVPTEEAMQRHVVAKSDGKIIGMAGCYPYIYRVGNVDLSVAVTGNVAVDEAYRGHGVMQTVLHRLIEEEKDAHDLLFLHGDRQRYRYFGYDRCGIECFFTLSRGMLGKDDPERKLQFVDLRAADADVVDAAYALSAAQPFGVIRSRADFMPALTAKSQTPLAVLSETGTLLGYVCVDKYRDSFTETVLADADLLYDVVKAYMQHSGFAKCFISLPLYHPLTKHAAQYADRYQIVQPGNFRVLNPSKVITAFMQAKGRYADLPDGMLRLDSEVFGKLVVAKEEESISVAPFEGEADISLPGFSAYGFLFGTLPPRTEGLSAQKAYLTQQWFPLPLHCAALS